MGKETKLKTFKNYSHKIPRGDIHSERRSMRKEKELTKVLLLILWTIRNKISIRNNF